MKKTRIFLIFFILISVFFIYQNFDMVRGATEGFIGLIIYPSDAIINIENPLNVSYNFAVGSNYTLNLNVSSPSLIQNWWYKLEDLRHNELIIDDMPFTPNTTFNAVRWENKLTVYGDNGNMVGSEEVYFFINVPNTAPVIGDIPAHSFVCEYSPVYIYFNVTNLDEDALNYSMFPTNPLYLFRADDIDRQTNAFFVSSLNLTKNHVGNISERVSVTDGYYSDTKRFNLTVIEINRIPQFENLGVKTLYTYGENSSLYEQWDILDVEDGNSSEGNFNFNISFSGEELFSIDQYGIMNFSANSSYIGVHNITVCVNDSSLDYIHPNISLCNVTGLSNHVCDEFSITVTTDNRPPRIENYYPSNFSFLVTGDEQIYFNLTSYDPDYTIPDAYWYVDGNLTEYDDDPSFFREFYYNFSCGMYGYHNFSVIITDGLENASLNWNITLLSEQCPVISTSSGGGGGGGGGEVCKPNLGCEGWSTCQNLENSFLETVINASNYLILKKNCSIVGLKDDSCGYQVRSCMDIAGCTRRVLPQEAICQYTFNPSCEDNIRNCHDGDCEVLVDCGGPCNSCFTCSDGIKNQAEEGIDCGGPCPNLCKYDNPFIKKEELKYTIYIIVGVSLLLLIILIILNIIRIVKIKNEIGELNWYELLKVKKKY